MNYGGLWAAHLFITVDSSHENKPKGHNVKRLHTKRGVMRIHAFADRR